MRLVRRLALVGGAVALITTTLGAPAPVASADVGVDEAYPVPASGVYTLDGHGWGHGHGLSQWGAYGAAKVAGLDYKAILAFYYPNTTLTTENARTVRVRLHAETGGAVVVRPISGRTLTASTTVANVAACALPTSLDGGKTTVKWWRARTVTANGAVGVQLQATVDGRAWQPASVPGCDAAWASPMAGSITFADGPSVDLVYPGGWVTRYRGRVRASFTGTGIYPVNLVVLDAYLRSVVPSEMPASWSPAALQAQAVAARTYATYGIQHPKTAYYDVYDDTRDQAYTGVPNEDPRSDAAVSATAGQVLDDSTGHAAFTQFSAADGGWTAYGGQSYLPAHRDQYDGAVPNSADSWTTSLSAAQINAVFGGQIGSLREIDITGRDGNGQWGGRVTAMTLRGDRGSVSLSGTAFRNYFALRSEWFHLQVPPNAPTYVTASRTDTTAVVAWRPPASSSGSPVTGYQVTLQPGGATQTVAASARRATFTGLSPDTDYTASVAATSDAGLGRAATITTKVSRVNGGGAIGVATAASRATFADGAARTVVLASTAGYADALAGGPFAAAHHAPLLLTSRGALAAATQAEIQRVLPKGRVVYLLGPSSVLGDNVRTAVRALGYRVLRLAGADPASTAVLLARHTRGVQAVFEATSTTWRHALLAAPAAAAQHGVILLTDGSTQSRATAGWLAAHPSLPRYAVGGPAAAADPSAVALSGSNAYRLAAAVAQKFFATPQVSGVVTAAHYYPALVEGARLAAAGGPVLFAATTRLPGATGGYLSAVRSGLRGVELAGGGLAYYGVESGVQAILLG